MDFPVLSHQPPSPPTILSKNEKKERKKDSPLRATVGETNILVCVYVPYPLAKSDAVLLARCYSIELSVQSFSTTIVPPLSLSLSLHSLFFPLPPYPLSLSLFFYHLISSSPSRSGNRYIPQPVLIEPASSSYR
jgi:hypothetical protein